MRSLVWVVRRHKLGFVIIIITTCSVYLLLSLERKDRYTRILEDHIYHLQSHVEGLQKTNSECGTKLSPANTIYIITPTHSRPHQKAELTRLSHTFRLVSDVLWIVVEDSEQKTELVRNFLKDCKVPNVHLNAVTPADWKLAPSDPNWRKPRGVIQRNKGLTWLRTSKNKEGVVYFADDDNTYDTRLFDEMREVEKVGVWPVGLVGGLMVERPIVENNKVTKFNSVWKPTRPFPIDMAGFAINLSLLLKHKGALFKYDAPRGYLESTLLNQLVRMQDLEPKADSCSKVYVWHTQTQNTKLKDEAKLREKGQPSNYKIEV